MGEFSVYEFKQSESDDVWVHKGTTAWDVSLVETLAAVGMGLPWRRPLRFELIALEIEIVSRLIESPVAGQLRRRPVFEHAPRRLRSLSAEALGLVAATRIAELWHGWDPSYGWPLDLDAKTMPGKGVRPDLLFPTPRGDVAGEARGRTIGRLWTHAAPAQARRMKSLERWSAEVDIKVFMAWVWATTEYVRADYFDPGERREVIYRETLSRLLRIQAEVLYQSTDADIEFSDVAGVAIPGRWLQPSGLPIDVFVGVLPPEAVVANLEALDTEAASTRDQPRGSLSAEAERTPGRSRAAGPIVRGIEDRLREMEQQRPDEPGAAVVGPVVTAIRQRRQQ